jgi:hypothetical protein
LQDIQRVGQGVGEVRLYPLEFVRAHLQAVIRGQARMDEDMDGIMRLMDQISQGAKPMCMTCDTARFSDRRWPAAFALVRVSDDAMAAAGGATVAMGASLCWSCFKAPDVMERIHAFLAARTIGFRPLAISEPGRA